MRETDGAIPLGLNLTNQNITVSLPADTQLVQSNMVDNYSGILSVPTPKAIESINNEEVISAFKVGGSAESLKLTG